MICEHVSCLQTHSNGANDQHKTKMVKKNGKGIQTELMDLTPMVGLFGKRFGVEKKNGSGRATELTKQISLNHGGTDGETLELTDEAMSLQQIW